MNVLEIIFVIYAVYLFFLTVKMKRTREIPVFLVNNRINLDNAKDKEGYIDYMVPRLFGLEASIIIITAVSVASNYITSLSIVSIVCDVVFFIVIIIFGVMTVKAQNRFLFGMEKK